VQKDLDFYKYFKPELSPQKMLENGVFVKNNENENMSTNKLEPISKPEF
tara:strand:- start:42 stop:188 length:147 start_codon:yes stop_codon:yes gene_type:complete